MLGIFLVGDKLSEERLQKLISRAGLMSRREAENFIVAGRVTVDGEVVNMLILKKIKFALTVKS